MEKKGTDISTVGQFNLADRLAGNFIASSPATVGAAGDDAAVITSTAGTFKLMAQAMLLEGVHFDLTYFPLKHLGYKSVVAACSRIYAMNGQPQQISVTAGISAKLSVEALEEFFAGVKQGCSDYGTDLAGLELSTSITGFIISVSALGEVISGKVTHRKGAGENDLICITGDLGSAYMGLKLLEREQRALEGHPDPKPQFEGFEYLLERQLRPRARRDTIEALKEEGLVPTSMILLRDGLASDMLQICKASDCGARIYLNRIPIASQTYKMAEELNADPVVAALNGGEDYELLFTVPLASREKVINIGGIDIIGHITNPHAGVALVTPDGGEIALTAPGWTAVL